MIQNIINIEAQLLCIIFLAVLWMYNVRFEHYMKKTLKGIYIVTFIALIADVFKYILYGSKSSLLIHTLDIIYYISFGVVGFLWCYYCLKRFDKKLCQKLWFKILSVLPISLMAVTALVSFVKKNVYSVGINGMYSRGDGYYFVFIIYTVLVWVFAVRAVRRSPSNRQKRERMFLALLTMPAVFAVVVQIIIPGETAIMPAAITVSLLILFINSQYKKIRVDNLTRLLNRYGMEDEIFIQLEQYKKDKNDLFYVILCDLDNFKYINDTWGHQEGDRALRIISDVLIRVAEKYDSQAFRIGGDEFVIFVDVSEDTIPKEICSVLKTELDNIDFRDDFDIRMSMGLAKYDGIIPVDELLNSADMELYEAKRKSKQENK